MDKMHMPCQLLRLYKGCSSSDDLYGSLYVASRASPSHRGSQVDPSFVLPLIANVGRLFVEADPKALQLMLNQSLVPQWLQHIQHNEDQVAGSSHCGWKQKQTRDIRENSPGVEDIVF